MTLDEFKNEVEQRTGVPASLLDGSTAGEIVTMAKTILAYKKECDVERQNTPREQFAAWLNESYGVETQNGMDEALDDLTRTAAAENCSYPVIQDGQVDTSGIPDGRTPEQQFSEWWYKKTAFDPAKKGSWKKLI